MIEFYFSNPIFHYKSGTFLIQPTMSNFNHFITMGGYKIVTSPSKPVGLAVKYGSTVSMTNTNMVLNLTTKCRYIPKTSILAIEFADYASTLGSTYNYNPISMVQISPCQVYINGELPSESMCWKDGGKLYVSNFLTKDLMSPSILIDIKNITVPLTYFGAPNFKIYDRNVDSSSLYLNTTISALVTPPAVNFGNTTYSPIKAGQPNLAIRFEWVGAVIAPLPIGSSIEITFTQNFVAGMNLKINILNRFNQAVEEATIVPTNSIYTYIFTKEYSMDKGFVITLSGVNSPQTYGTYMLKAILSGPKFNQLGSIYSFPMVFSL